MFSKGITNTKVRTAVSDPFRQFKKEHDIKNPTVIIPEGLNQTVIKILDNTDLFIRNR